MKKTILLILSISIIITFAGCGNKRSSVSRTLLGTVVTITIIDDPDKTAADFDAAFGEIEKVQKSLNPYNPDSEISMINKTAPFSPRKVPDDVFSLISDSLKVSEISSGAFDITFASTGKLWDFSSHSEENFTPPDDKTIKKLLPLISYKNVVLDTKARTVKFLKSGTKIGLGGIAKGYATGRAVSALKARNVRNAIVSSAGDIQALGDNNGVKWKLGIQDPRGNSVIASIDMNDGESVSTSGDYERFRIVNGKRYHHIIDPATGYPSDSGLISASVFSNNPVLSDAYSTALFVSGLEKSRQILDKMNNLSAVLVTSDMKVYVSERLKGRIVFREDLKVVYF